MSDKTISKDQNRLHWKIKLTETFRKIKEEMYELDRLCSSQHSVEHEERRNAYKIKLRQILGAARRPTSIAMKDPKLRRLCEEVRERNRRDGIPNEYTRSRRSWDKTAEKSTKKDPTESDGQ